MLCLKPGESTTLNLNATITSTSFAAAGWGSVFNGNDLGYILADVPMTCVATGVSGVTGLQNTASGKICNVTFDPAAGSGSATTVLTVDANATPGPTLYDLGVACSGCTVNQPPVQVQVVCQ